MTQFQLLCAALFAVAALFVYRGVFISAITRLLGKLPHCSNAPVVKPSIAVNLVDDIVSVTELRDRLSAEGCQEGVDACTVLLRVIVEFKEPSKGVV